MNNDLLFDGVLDYQVNRIREDWRPIRARRARRRARREEESRVAQASETSTWIG